MALPPRSIRRFQLRRYCTNRSVNVLSNGSTFGDAAGGVLSGQKSSKLSLLAGDVRGCNARIGGRAQEQTVDFSTVPVWLLAIDGSNSNSGGPANQLGIKVSTVMLIMR